jgi:hypothetical protein
MFPYLDKIVSLFFILGACDQSFVPKVEWLTLGVSCSVGEVQDMCRERRRLAGLGLGLDISLSAGI